MPQLWIKAQPGSGTDIRDAARLAIRLASRADVGVELTFNNIQLKVMPGSAVDQIFHEYRRQLALSQTQEVEPT